MAVVPATLLLNKLSRYSPHLTDVPEVAYVMEELTRVSGFISRTDFRRENEHVNMWLMEVRRLVYEVEDILDELMLLSSRDHGDGLGGLVRRLGHQVRYMKARYRLVADLTRVISGLQRVVASHKTRVRQVMRSMQFVPLDGSDNTPSPQQLDDPSHHLVGLDEPKRVLVHWLVEGSNSMEVISVVGMGGVGKTTLIRQVYEDPATKKQFGIRAWINLLPSKDIGELLEDVLHQIDCQMRGASPRWSGFGTPNMNWLRLMFRACLHKRRYLIVVDEVWQLDKWDAIKSAFPNDECGSRVILSTRNSSIASAASHRDFNSKVYSLQPLSDELSWELLCKKTFGESKACPPNLVDTSRLILKKCMHLPVAIVALSGVLASLDKKMIHQWEFIRRSLRAEMEKDHPLAKINRVISLCFNVLPYYLKPCFMYFALFHEGQEVEVTRLIRLWVAEGFVQKIEGKTPEEVAYDNLLELLNRNLLLVVGKTSNGRIKTCLVGNVIRHIGITMSHEEEFAAQVFEHTPLPQNVRRLLVNNYFPSPEQNKTHSKLRSLFVKGDDKSSVKAVLRHDHALLAVLDLQASSLRKFPIQVCGMLCLKYLSLRYTSVSTIPSSIGNLIHLETLDLKHTYVTELPAEIGKLQQLRHLLVYRYKILESSYSTYGFRTTAEIGALQCLQNLSKIEANGEQTHTVMKDIGKLIQLKRLCILKLKQADGKVLCSSMEKLRNLMSLSLSSSDECDQVLDLQHLDSPPPQLNRIYLRGHLQVMPHWMHHLSNLTVLFLGHSHLKDDPLSYLQHLPQLIHLEMQQVYDWKALHIKASGFKKLETLGLYGFPNLTKIELEEGAMPRLARLTLQQCQSLQDIPRGMHYLTKLSILELFAVHTELIRKLKMEDYYCKVAHIPEVRYGSLTDRGWPGWVLDAKSTKNDQVEQQDCSSSLEKQQ